MRFDFIKVNNIYNMKKYILSLCVMMSISIITVAQDTRVIAPPMTLITNRIADNGNIGIGTTTPNSKLDIVGGHISLNDDTADLPFHIWAGGAGGANHMRIGTDYGHYGDAAIEIYQNAVSGVTPAEPGRVVINGDLTIGINKGFRAKDANGAERRIVFNNSASGENLYMGHIDAGWGGGLLFNSGQYINFAVNNKNGVLNAMKINTDGNVGIGTTAPSAKLDVNGEIKGTQFSTEGTIFHSEGITSNNNALEITSVDEIAIDSPMSVEVNAPNVSLSDLVYINNGKVGIGTTAPANKLDVNGDIRFSTKLVIATDKGTLWENAAGNVELQAGSASSGLELRTTTANPILFSTNGGSERMRILGNGNVGIGTTTTGAHKLAVDGSIGAREVKVENTAWSDFVFEKDYRLPTLKEVAQHIQEKGHLKDIPSAKEVAENGIFLGEMDAKLLQKIEELTLYTLAQEEKINAANAKIAHLESEKEDLKKLSKLVAALQTKMDAITAVKK